MSNINEARNVIINDLELFWAKLDKPVEPFGEAQWEIQVRFPKKRIKEMEQYGKVKETDTAGIYSLNLKKKAVKKDGTPAQKVKLTGKKIDPETGEPQVIPANTLGNGSKGNVKLMLKDYEIKGPKGNITKSGTQVMLVAVQVIEYIKYVPKGNDFDYDSDEDDTPAKAAPKKNAPKKAAADDMDDDIPF